MSRKISYFHGTFFPIVGLIFGGCIFAFGVAVLINSSGYFSFSLGVTILCFAALFFSTKGFEIDLGERKVRTFTKVLGFKTGKIIPLVNFKYLTIINQTYSRTSVSRGGAGTTSNFGKYNLLLLNETHHLKQLVESFDSHEEAITEAKQLSEELKLEIVTYNPVRTRSRKAK